MSHYFIEDPREHGLKFNPFKALVAPRPIAWVSTVSAQGVVNLAPYSFFNAVSDAPPMIVFAPNNPRGLAGKMGQPGIHPTIPCPGAIPSGKRASPSSSTTIGAAGSQSASCARPCISA